MILQMISHYSCKVFPRLFTNLINNKNSFSFIKFVSNSNIKINQGIFKSPYLLSSPKYSFTRIAQQNPNYFIFNHQKQPQLLKLQLQYRSKQNISIFQNTIKQSTGILDQMNIFKIFKVMQASPYNHSSYQFFYQIINNSIKRKSDNMLLLLATVKQRISRNYKKQNNIPKTLESLQQALDTLEGCMVPPLLPYYSIYRQYGILQDELGNRDKAKQILTQAVDILDDFVSHSDDNVSTNSYCKKQARAYNVLSRIDKQNFKKWIQKANSIWQKYTQNKYNEIEYAKTIALNINKELKQDKQKGQAYYHFNLYKFENKQMKDLLKKAKEQSNV